MDTRTVISYGGGVQSTALAALAVMEAWVIDEIVHVDLLDAENPATRLYVRKFADWVEKECGMKITVIPSDLLGDMLANPSFVAPPFLARDGSFMLRRQCTSQYKIRPFVRHLTAMYPEAQFKVMLGISVDEWHRMRDSEHPKIEHVYPLVERLMRRSDCERVIKRAGLPVPEKSSCWFCPYRRAYQQDRIVSRHPHLELLAEKLEEKINDARRARGKPEIKVLKRSSDLRQLELFCSAGWCDA